MYAIRSYYAIQLVEVRFLGPNITSFIGLLVKELNRGKSKYVLILSAVFSLNFMPFASSQLLGHGFGVYIKRHSSSS